MSDQNPPQHTPPTVPDYLAPRDDAEARARDRAHKSIGGVLSFGAVVGTVCSGIFANLHVGVPPYNASPDYVSPAVLGAILLAIIGVIGLFARAHSKSNAFFTGALIGLAVGALIEGFCFLKMM